MQDNQFSPVGLVLLAELSKTQRTLESLGGDDAGTEALTIPPDLRQHAEDVGERVSREGSIFIHPENIHDAI